MAFKLSSRSESRLEGVDPKLIEVVKKAIKLTRVDFGVIEGMRTLETQKKYVEAGKSQTLKSKHLEGRAVDLVAYVGSSISWELNLYDDVADSIKKAALEYDVAVKWGAAWSVGDIREFDGSMAEAMNEYIDLRRSQGRRPFIDAPHFELM
jgi:peptidoglycan L-alanyl-D-glutamate endopeptidase CwlK|tara:strand:- start:170 stop:622 length:453 start_codon:yes stop_codon:yes gene_type:complete